MRVRTACQRDFLEKMAFELGAGGSVYLRKDCLLQVAFICKQIGLATRLCRRLRAILPIVEETVAPFSRYRSALPWRVSWMTEQQPGVCQTKQ